MTESTGATQRKEDRREDVVFMYRTGEHIERIAVRVGCHVQTVKQIINAYEKERAGGEHVEEEFDGILRVL